MQGLIVLCEGCGPSCRCERRQPRGQTFSCYVWGEVLAYGMRFDSGMYSLGHACQHMFFKSSCLSTPPLLWRTGCNAAGVVFFYFGKRGDLIATRASRGLLAGRAFPFQ